MLGPRTRSRVLNLPYSIPSRYREVPGGGDESVPNTTGVYTQMYEEMGDSNNGTARPNTPMWKKTGTFAGQPGVACWYTPEQFGYQRIVVGGIGPPPADPHVTYTVTEANRVREAIEQTLGDEVLAPIILKELPEIRGTYRTLKERGFGLKQFASKFLAYKFGIAPFIGDLVDLAVGSEKISQHILKVNASAGVVTRRKMKVGEIGGSSNYYYPTGTWTAEERSMPYSGTAHAVVRTKVFRRYTEQDRLSLYADYYGGRLANVIWEAVPYSFVVDWFVNVGEVLNYLSPKFQPQMAQLQSACTVIRTSISLPTLYWDGGSGRVCSLGSRDWIIQSRTPCTGITPSSLLGVGSGLSLSKVAVGAALLLQKLG